VRDALGMDCILLRSLPDTERRDIIANARRRRFGRREVIFHEGDPGNSVHIVVKGHIGIRATTPLGDVAMLRVLGVDDFFGELALLDSAPRSATAFALGPAETFAIRKEHFDQLRASSSDAHVALTVTLASEVRRLAASLVEALYVPIELRLWRRVLELAEVFDASAGDPTTIPLTQEELAQLAGTTRSTANRMLRDAEAHGAVTLRRGELTVIDSEWIRRRST